MKQAEVRTVGVQDLDRIAQLEQEAFSDPWSVRALSESLQQSFVLMLGAWIEDTLAGYVIFYLTGSEGEIARIAVDEQYRRQGVAGALMHSLTQICREKAVRKLFLEVRESNQPARAFYAKNGFLEDGLRKNYYVRPAEHAVLMSRTPGGDGSQSG